MHVQPLVPSEATALDAVSEDLEFFVEEYEAKYPRTPQTT